MADRQSIDAETVKARLTDPRGVLLSLGIPSSSLTNRHGPCPACGGRDRYRYDNRHGQGDYFCNGCGPGDAFSMLMKVHRWTFPEAVERVAEVLGIQPNSKASFYQACQAPLRENQVAQVDSPEISKPLPMAEWEWQIWHKLKPARGTLVETYLANRKLTLPEDCPLYFHPRLKHTDPHTGEETFWPAMVAPIVLPTSDDGAPPLALHRTYLRPDGTGKAPVRPDRKQTSSIEEGENKRLCGVIKLTPESEVVEGLAICEGIETGLSAIAGGMATWSCLNAPNLEKFPVIEGLSLTIAADNDSHGRGQKAAETVARRWQQAEKEARIALAEGTGQDLNDILTGAA